MFVCYRSVELVILVMDPIMMGNIMRSRRFLEDQRFITGKKRKVIPV